MSDIAKGYSVLFASTLVFLITFMVWMTFAVIGIPLREELHLSATQFSILAAVPVLSGSILRLPFGMLADRFGGKYVMSALLIACIPFTYLISLATAYWQLIVIGLFMGIAGATFAVGTPYVARWFPKEKQGLAMGIFGAGTAGTALNNFLSPLLLEYFGDWRTVPQVYAGILIVTLVVFWLTSFHRTSHIVKPEGGVFHSLKLFKNAAVLRYSQYYTVVFGGYVGLTLWLTNYYVNEYQLPLQQAAFYALIFLLPGGLFRSVGGWLSDKLGATNVAWTVMWILWIGFLVLSAPMANLVVEGTNGPVAIHLGLSLPVFATLTFFIGSAMSIGGAAVFKSVANDFSNQMGAVSGIVGLAGGIFGFILPIAFSFALELTQIRSSAFMVMFSGISLSLILMHFSFRAAKKAAE